MGSDIKDLEKLKSKSQSLYSSVKEIVDNNTGEVSTIVTSFLRREKTREDFIKMFVGNIDFLVEGLSDIAIRVLLSMMKNLNYKNVFNYNSEFVGYLVSKNVLSKSSIYKAIKELEQKKVILRLTEEQKDEFEIFGSKPYIINPHIVGKGSFNDLRKLKRTIVKTYDFEKFELTQEVQVESEYTGFNEVRENPANFKLESLEKIQKDKMLVQEIVVSKKDEIIDVCVEPEPVKTIETQTKVSKEDVVENVEKLKLQLEIERLKNEKAQMQIEALKAQKELKKYKYKQPSLFGDEDENF